MISHLRKGDLYIANLQPTYDYMLCSEHPVIIMSNFKACEYSKSIQIIPITSKPKKPLDTHVKISKEFGLDCDSIALCEQIQTVDKSILLYRIGQLPNEIVLQVDRAANIQLNLNRNFNIGHALKIADNIKELDNFTKKYNIELDKEDKNLRDSLMNELQRYCYQYNIDYYRLISERGIKNDK